MAVIESLQCLMKLAKNGYDSIPNERKKRCSARNETLNFNFMKQKIGIIKCNSDSNNNNNKFIKRTICTPRFINGETENKQQKKKRCRYLKQVNSEVVVCKQNAKKKYQL